MGVPSLGDFASIENFVTDRGVGGFANIPDLDGEIWRRFGVTRQSAYALINDDGTLRVTGYGNLEGDVQALIAS